MFEIYNKKIMINLDSIMDDYGEIDAFKFIRHQNFI